MREDIEGEGDEGLYLISDLFPELYPDPGDDPDEPKLQILPWIPAGYGDCVVKAEVKIEGKEETSMGTNLSQAARTRKAGSEIRRIHILEVLKESEAAYNVLLEVKQVVPEHAGGCEFESWLPKSQTKLGDFGEVEIPGWLFQRLSQEARKLLGESSQS